MVKGFTSTECVSGFKKDMRMQVKIVVPTNKKKRERKKCLPTF